MATGQFNLSYDATTDAAFRVIGSAVSAQIAAMGFTQTADSGQVNWTTVTRPAADANTVYECWQSPSDGLTTFYFRINYIMTAGSTGPSFRIVVGTGTNTTGTITGTYTIPLTTAYGTQFSSAVASYDCRFCWDGASFVMLLWRDSAFPCVICIERSRDSSGVATGDYVTLYIVQQTATASTGRRLQQSLVFSIGVTTATTEFVCRMPNITSNAFHLDVGIGDIAPFVPYPDNPSLFLGCARGADFAEGGTFSTTVYGATHAFLVTKAGNNARVAPDGNSTGALIMRYE